MSVLGTISLSGLTATNSDFIQCGEIEVAQALIVDPGATVTLPNNSINDAALSSNVMLLNATQTSTQPKTFQASAVNTVPLAASNTAIAPNPKISLSPYTTAGGYNPIVQNGDAIIFTDNATGICLGPHTSSYSGFRADINNTEQYGKSSLTYYVWDSTVALKKVFEALATTITAYLPLYAPSPTTNTNDTRVITSAYGNNFFPQLIGNNTLTGLNTFTQSITGVTEPVAENSTKVATTAWVNLQGFLTTASLSGYAQLAANQTFTGTNTFNNWISVPQGIRLTNFSPSATPFSNSQYLGYHLYIPYSSWGVTPSSTWQSLYDFTFDNSTNLKYGLYLLEYTLRWTSTSGSGVASVNFSTTMAAQNSLYMTNTPSGSLNGSTYYYLHSFSFTQYISTPTTWYINCAVQIAGTVTFDNQSNVRLTRIG